MAALYVVIDTTTVESSKILYVAEMQASVYWGRILTDKGLKVIAPLLDAKAFSKLEQLPLQYLFWNTFRETPAEDYAQLVQNCLTKALALPVDKTDLRELERDANRAYQHKMAQYTPETDDPNALSLAAAAPQQAASSRPRAAGATKQVWDIADRMAAEADGTIPNRQDFIAECVRCGINASTASTQFSKWKSSHVRPN